MKIQANPDFEKLSDSIGRRGGIGRFPVEEFKQICILFGFDSNFEFLRILLIQNFFRVSPPAQPAPLPNPQSVIDIGEERPSHESEPPNGFYWFPPLDRM